MSSSWPGDESSSNSDGSSESEWDDDDERAEEAGSVSVSVSWVDSPSVSSVCGFSSVSTQDVWYPSADRQRRLSQNVSSQRLTNDVGVVHATPAIVAHQHQRPRRSPTLRRPRTRW